MPVDDGAQRILDLLSLPNEELGKNSRKLAKAQLKAIDKPYGVMPQYGINALAEIRNYYRALRVQIDSIDTIDAQGKGNALLALDSIDNALDTYEASLEKGISKQAIPKAKAARNQSKFANQTLKAAMRGLA